MNQFTQMLSEMRDADVAPGIEGEELRKGKESAAKLLDLMEDEFNKNGKRSEYE